MTDEDAETHLLHGYVKWFDPTKGFGFIVSDETQTDVLLHANVLRNFGQGSIADGTRISVRVLNTQRGVQAIEVLSIEPPEGESFTFGSETGQMARDEVLALSAEPARVKWFDKVKGFGFANVFGKSEDVFIHVEVLRLSGFADLITGEAVALRIVDGKRGRMAVQVVPWETVARDKA
ncbi:cold shock domain-containing protein [Tabrizicola sp.]|uniref:cold-shock protein n=1 Tax=Tabrizicola sp. TaxID=2005166 RepID=UPI00286BC1DB|nr:cold shock domain-containing protein [Tabrizicola sp.]